MNEFHTIKYFKEYKHDRYEILLVKLKDVILTTYLSDYLFYSKLINKTALKKFIRENGNLTSKDKNILKEFDVVRITKVTNDKNIFEVI